MLHILIWRTAPQHTQEADEVLSDASGRWWTFNIAKEHLFILEKKGIPEHLKAIENLDKAVTLASLITDLEDLGEVSWCSIHVGQICPVQGKFVSIWYDFHKLPKSR